ncbi:MAG: flavodoxin domain-containing protein, partial [Anaerovoracaceae bacterium]
DIKFICPLHGPLWRNNFEYFIDKHNKWSKYQPEEKGVLIVYASMYGNTEAVSQVLANKLCQKGLTNFSLYDVSKNHVSTLIAESFKYSHIVLASVTYNLEIYPPMHNFLNDMRALNLQNRTFAVIENGTWAIKAGDLIEKYILDNMKNMTLLGNRLTITSSCGNSREEEIDTLVDTLIESVNK